jgi:ADP-ribose pyrophosphatase YjhB (NUDIX family)
MAQPPSQPVQARFAHENGTQLRLQCFVTVRDAQQRIAALRIQGYDGWCLPGESMLVNESPDDAARRVARTWFETPIGMQLDRVLSFPATGADDDRWYLLFVYQADAPADLKGTSDTIEIKFFPHAQPPPQFAMAHKDVWEQLG